MHSKESILLYLLYVNMKIVQFSRGGWFSLVSFLQVLKLCLIYCLCSPRNIHKTENQLL